MKNTDNNKIKETEGILLNDEELGTVAGGTGGGNYTTVRMTMDQFMASNSMHICPKCTNMMTNIRKNRHYYYATCESCMINYIYNDRYDGQK